MPANHWTRYLFGAVIALIIGYLVYRFSTIVAYVIAAWVLSLIGQPLARLYRRIKIGRFQVGPSAAAVMTIISFFLATALIFTIFLPLVFLQANNLANMDYQKISQALQTPYNSLIQWLSSFGIAVEDGSLEDMVRNAFTNWFELNKVGYFITQAATAVGNTLIHIFSTIFITFFFLQDRRLFSNFLLAIVPEKYKAQTREAIQDTVTLLTRYFAGIVLQMTVITIYVSLFLTILGIENALLIGLFAALMNIIPYLGPFLGGTLGLFITITSNLDLDFTTQMLPLVLKVLAVFITVQWLDNYFLSPTIFSKSVMAHPLEIFLVILMGANVSGFLGMVLAIPAYTVIRVIAKEFLFESRFVQKLTERMKEEGI